VQYRHGFANVIEEVWSREKYGFQIEFRNIAGPYIEQQHYSRPYQRFTFLFAANLLIITIEVFIQNNDSVFLSILKSKI